MNFISRLSYFIMGILFLGMTSCGKTDTAISNPIADCFDNIQNQGEKGVDCGGPCVPCPGKMTAKIDGQDWESVGLVTGNVINNVIRITGSSSNSTLILNYDGPFEPGSYNIQSALYTNSFGVQYTTMQGSITFSDWDDENNLVFGTFNFTAFELLGTDTVFVTNGTFDSVSYP